VRKGDGSQLIEIHSHHDLDEILLDLLPLGIPHRNERDVPPEMVELLRIGVNNFPCKSPLFECKVGPNPFLKMKVIICRFGSSYEENGLSAQ
jgi:hypothetical protein